MANGDEEFQRVLALDLGQKRIGVAVSDPFGNFAVGLETIARHEKKDVLDELKPLIERYNVTRIVLGLPLHMKGHEGIGAENAREFGRRIEAELNLPVEYMDERLTSVIAQQTLREQGVQGSKNKGLIDQAAAMRILQDYLDRKART